MLLKHLLLLGLGGLLGFFASFTWITIMINQDLWGKNRELTKEEWKAGMRRR